MYKLKQNVKIKGIDKEGIVVDVWGSQASVNKYEILIGVQFIEKIENGHNCRGNGEDGKCQYFKVEEIEWQK